MKRVASPGSMHDTKYFLILQISILRQKMLLVYNLGIMSDRIQKDYFACLNSYLFSTFSPHNGCCMLYTE